MNIKSILAVAAVVFGLCGSENQFILAQSGTRSPGIISGSGSRGMSPAYPNRTYQPHVSPAPPNRTYQPHVSPAPPNRCGQMFYPRYGVQPAATYLPGCSSTHPVHNPQNQMIYGSRQPYQPAGSTYRQPGTITGLQYLTNSTNLSRTPSGNRLLPLQQLPLPVPAQ